MTDFAANLRRIRLERGYTQTRLSELIGKSSCVVAQYESGHRTPRLENLTALARTLGVAVEVLSGAPPVPGLTGPHADRLVAAFAGLSARDRETVVRLAESLAVMREGPG